jgi:hypothetical protein
MPRVYYSVHLCVFTRFAPAGDGCTFHSSFNISVNLVKLILMGNEPNIGVNKV